MAKYTTQLRSYIESGGKVFDFTYPIFDEKYKTVLETKIIENYYFREIGLETIGQFKWFLKSKMNRIMPYYNQMYESNEAFKNYDPYKNKDFKVEDTRTINTDSKSNSSNTASDTTNTNNTEKFSDTPQAMNQGKDYLTNMTKNDGSTSGSSKADGSATGEVTTTETYIQLQHGHDGMKYPAGILLELRQTFINIDQMIIDELNDLFMNVY